MTAKRSVTLPSYQIDTTSVSLNLSLIPGPVEATFNAQGLNYYLAVVLDIHELAQHRRLVRACQEMCITQNFEIVN